MYFTGNYRSGERGRRMENLRTVSRRRSLSPRHSQHSDYSSQGTTLPHVMNQPPSKTYQGMPPDDGHYSSTMHYDSGMRRSTEDRPGTPTVSMVYRNTSLLSCYILYYKIELYLYGTFTITGR